MTSQWQIHDIIDLEYFLAGGPKPEHQKSGGNNSAENRKIYLEYIKKNPDKTDRSSVFRHWLSLWRRSEGSDGRQKHILPGQIYRETMQTGCWIGFFSALFTGASLAGSLLSYKGTTPVNVFTFLWILLAPQLLLLLLLGAGAILSRIRPAWRKKGLYALISALLRRLANLISPMLSERILAERRSQIRSTMGLVGRTRTVYGSVFFWPVFNIAQVIGIGFNIGILAALLLRITLTDLAFGWQSTLQPDARTVYSIVEFMAAPWAWLVDTPWSHPTAAQIAGSKMVLKDGIYDLATPDLASWWPFLCLSVMCYGLAPRVLLFAFGKWQHKKKLAGLDFAHSECDRLWLEMTTPIVQTPDQSPAAEKQIPVDIHSAGAQKVRNHSIPDQPGAKTILIVPQEAEMDVKALGRRIKKNLGLISDTVIKATGDLETDIEKISSLPGAKGGGPVRVVVVTEAWQPPIKESMTWIKQVRQAIGKSLPLIIYLTGKPGKHGDLPCPPDQTEQKIWQQAIGSLSDPYTRVESLDDQSQ